MKYFIALYGSSSVWCRGIVPLWKKKKNKENVFQFNKSSLSILLSSTNFKTRLEFLIKNLIRKYNFLEKKIHNVKKSMGNHNLLEGRPRWFIWRQKKLQASLHFISLYSYMLTITSIILKKKSSLIRKAITALHKTVNRGVLRFWRLLQGLSWKITNGKHAS